MKPKKLSVLITSISEDTPVKLNSDKAGERVLEPFHLSLLRLNCIKQGMGYFDSFRLWKRAICGDIGCPDMIAVHNQFEILTQERIRKLA